MIDIIFTVTSLVVMFAAGYVCAVLLAVRPKWSDPATFKAKWALSVVAMLTIIGARLAILIMEKSS